VAQAHVEIARRGYAAINKAYEHDSVDPLEPMLDEFWAPDAVLVTSGRLFPEAGEWPGKEGMLRFARQQMDAFERMWAEPDDYIETDDGVLVRLRLGGVARHTGITMEFEIFHVLTFRDNKLTRLEAHVDEADARRAAGLPAG
jgi:ketosteroid isomerase-like protein